MGKSLEQVQSTLHRNLERKNEILYNSSGLQANPTLHSTAMVFTEKILFDLMLTVLVYLALSCLNEFRLE